MSKILSTRSLMDQTGTYVKEIRTSCVGVVAESFVRCPTGTLKLVACSKGMHELTLAKPLTKISSDMCCEEDVGNMKISSHPSLEHCMEWLKAFFCGDISSLKSHQPSLCPHIFNHESFRSKVWCILEEKVPFGSTVSYGELARLCGSPGASQAVGSAMRNNPLSLVVPCHRVILSSGKPGNYAGGKMNDTKIWLLEHEKRFAA